MKTICVIFFVFLTIMGFQYFYGSSTPDTPTTQHDPVKKKNPNDKGKKPDETKSGEDGFASSFPHLMTREETAAQEKQQAEQEEKPADTPQQTDETPSPLAQPKANQETAAECPGENSDLATIIIRAKPELNRLCLELDKSYQAQLSTSSGTFSFNKLRMQQRKWTENRMGSCGWTADQTSLTEEQQQSITECLIGLYKARLEWVRSKAR